MNHIGELFLLLMVAIAALTTVARVMGVPYPIPLVLGGLLIGLIPGLPTVQLNPDLVLVILLPPLLYSAAFFASLRDLQRDLRPISLLAVGLVIATACGVAVVAHALIPGIGWGAAFTLGAVVAPTDPIAAATIARAQQAPRRIVTIIEGESLINDGTALVLLRTAIVAAVAGTFSPWEAGARLVLSIVGGVAIGLAVGYVVRRVRRRLDNPPLEITIAFLTGYLAFLPAAAVGVSGVLAAVTAGVYLGWYTPEVTTVETRLQGSAFWEIVTFLLNVLLFGLVGLQLRPILDGLSGLGAGTLVGDAAVVVLAVVAIRFAWVFASMYLPKRLIPHGPERRRTRPWRYSTFIAWNGMRGAVTIAAALLVPLTTDAGGPLPGRGLVVFLAFAVVLATLVGQGLSLPYLIQAIGIQSDEAAADNEESQARILAAEAALVRLDELQSEAWVREDTAERMRGLYRFRIDRFRSRSDPDGDGKIEKRSLKYQRLRRELLEAERRAVVELRNTGEIRDEVMRRIERDLDLEASRLDT